MSQNQQESKTHKEHVPLHDLHVNHLTTLLQGRPKYFGLYLALCLVQEGYDIGSGGYHFPVSEYFSVILANSSSIKLQILLFNFRNLG